MKKEYSFLSGGLTVGILLALLGVYFYNKGNLKFPKPEPPPAADNNRIDDGNRPLKPSGGLQVRRDYVKMRDCPGFGCREIAILAEGTPVEELGESDIRDNLEWIRVRAGALNGWVCRSFLE
jgi:hypothetical protein